jgi:peptide/nickel transport system substrate-binding protein
VLWGIGRPTASRAVYGTLKDYTQYDTLIRRDFNNTPPDGGARLVPGLATSWQRIDPTTRELKLRKGVTFHDGNPFTADDLLTTFSTERLRVPKSFSPRGRIYFGYVVDVQKIDDYTVRFVTKKPDLVLEHRLSSYTSFVICDNAWNAFRKDGEDYKVWMDKAYKSMRWKPVGTEPYKFVSYRKNDPIKLMTHDQYREGKPAAQSIIFREVPEVSARISGVVSGEYQMVVEVPPDQWEILDRYKDIVTRSTVRDNSHVFVFNTPGGRWLRAPLHPLRPMPMGIVAALNRNKPIDRLVMSFAVFGFSMPNFFLVSF